MVFSLKFKKDVVILKMLLWILCFGFDGMPHPSCYLTSIMNKTHHEPVIALFSLQLQQLFSYLRGILVTNHFSMFLTDRYILAIQQIIRQEKHLRNSFWSAAIFGTASETLEPWSQQQKVAKTTSTSLSLSNSSQESTFFAVLIYGLYGHRRCFKFKQNNQQHGPIFQTIFPFLMTMITQDSTKIL